MFITLFKRPQTIKDTVDKIKKTAWKESFGRFE